MALERLDFDQLTFSGGGIRCFWHGGFLCEMEKEFRIEPERVSGVSGGALSGAAWIGGREETLREVMRDAFEENERNLARDKANFTPHQEMYRAVVEETLDAEAMEAIANGPAFEVALSCPPQSVPPRISAVLYGFAYQAEQAIRSTPHLEWPRALGLEQLRVDARRAAREGHLVDLICAAATIPPVFDVPEWEGDRVLDGGMTDKAPLPSEGEGRTMVLLTRRYRHLPQHPDRAYFQPSCEVAADKIDFTDADKIDKTWEQGQADARGWLELD